MQIIGVSPNWSEEDGLEALEAILGQFRQSAPAHIVIGTADADMGASFTTFLINAAGAATIALTIIDAPSIIEDNWQKWKGYFDQVIAFSREVFERFSIDRNTAEVIAIKSVQPYLTNGSEISVDFRYRHVASMVTFFENLDHTKGRHINDTPDGNAEATSQWLCRYYFGISVGIERYTVLVENNGDVAFCEKVGK